MVGLLPRQGLKGRGALGTDSTEAAGEIVLKALLGS